MGVVPEVRRAQYIWYLRFYDITELLLKVLWQWFISDVPAESKMFFVQEDFDHTKGVMRIRKSMKNRQHNGQRKKDKRTNNDLQNIHIKLKIE